jgi:hypothetical protein
MRPLNAPETRSEGVYCKSEGSSDAAEHEFAKRTMPEAADHEQVGMEIRRHDRQFGRGAGRLYRDHACFRGDAMPRELAHKMIESLRHCVAVFRNSDQHDPDGPSPCAI